MRSPALIRTVALCAAFVFTIGATAQQTVTVDANAPTTPFPHFWEQMFGSGRAILTLRESYRSDMRAVKKVADFKYVRFHAILQDEVGVYNEDNCKPVYNFAYVDQIYDGLLKNGVKPFVEISFMPKKLAFNPEDLHPFWYKQNVSPPKSMELWDDLIKHFAQHLVDRYGIDEVSSWYFEVWNEPNIDFWGGVPRQRSYFDLYAHTARDLKAVSPRIRVGGPATAAAAWIPAFLKFTSENHVPVDFVSTHAYADDPVLSQYPMDERVCGAVADVHRQIQQSSTPNLPFFLTEWNVQGMHEARDTIFVGPALANTIRQCDGKVNLMSFWTFSDVFEEGGPIPKPFVGMFGLRAKGGINKPSYYGYGLLHELGDKRIAAQAKDVLVTKTSDGGLAVAAWNLVDPDKQGTTKTIKLVFEHTPANARVTIEPVDQQHGNVLPEYRKMGSPEDPTPAQVDQLNLETALPPANEVTLTGNALNLTLTPNALVLVKLTESK